jgi:hypothetical protein
VTSRSPCQSFVAFGALVSVALTGWGHEAAAADFIEVHQLRLELGRRASASCRPGSDDVSAVLEIENAGKVDRKMGTSARLGKYLLRLRRSLGRRLVGIITGPRGRIRCRVTKRGKALHVLIGRLEPKYALKAFKREVLEESPFGRDAVIEKAEEEIRRHVAAGAVAQALIVLNKLRLKARYADYARVRTGDLHLVAGRIPTAYQVYKDGHRRLSRLDLKLLSGTRMAELSYLIDDGDPPEELFERYNRFNSPAGKVVSRRLARLLLLCRKLDKGLDLAAPEKEEVGRKIAMQLLEARLREALWANDPYKAALVYLRFERNTAAAVSRPNILFLAARAFIGLDLPTDAIKLLHIALPAAGKDADLRERIVAALAQAYRCDDQRYRARQVVDHYLGNIHNGPNRMAMIRVRAELMYLEGDLKGARADLARLGPEEMPLLRAVVGKTPDAAAQSGELMQMVESLEQRQAALMKKLEASKGAKK